MSSIQGHMKKQLVLFLVTMNVLTFGASVSAETDIGKDVYMKTCSKCHAKGENGAPMVGDKEAWQKRTSAGMDDMVKHAKNGMQERVKWDETTDFKVWYQNAIQGFQGKSGYMPPRGSNSVLTDEEISAAIIYMLEQNK